ncbi:MAG: FAD-linked oxidase C-terminal domain-containing protein [Bacillota bacterium]
MQTQKLLNELTPLLGKENIISDAEELHCYSFDATADMPSQTPDVVVTPTCTGDVVKIVKFAAEHKIPVYTRGSGTNLSGGTIPVKKGIVMSMLKMNQILEIDAENLTATVQPGVIIQTLNDAVAKYGLIYPPDPGTVTTATMGGSVAENSGGLRGLKYGVTKHYVMGLEVVLANGDVIRWGGKTVKNVTAYDLVMLFVGSEGTLGVITEITVKLMPAPEDRKSMLATFNSIEDAAKTITGIIANKVIPATLEIMDTVTIKTVENYARVGLPLDAEAVLLIEVDGLPEVVAKQAEAVARVCQENHGALRIAETDAERDRLWTARRAALPALAQVSPTTVLEDATVPRNRIPDMLKALQDISQKYKLTIGTFGHAGDGNLHPTILTDKRNKEEMERVHQAVDEIFETAIKLGGTLSGEHGIGIGKIKYLEHEFGKAGVELLKTVKKALDPDNIFNPGKVVNI